MNINNMRTSSEGVGGIFGAGAKSELTAWHCQYFSRGYPAVVN
jgi:hypothetical protein